MHLGSMRVSKADGSQALDLQRDALLASGVRRQHLYEDLASGRRDDRPGLAACLKALELDRKQVRAHAMLFSWRACTEEFVRNLDPLPQPEKRRFWKRLRRLARLRRKAA